MILNILESHYDEILWGLTEFHSIKDRHWDIVLIVEDETKVNVVERVLGLLNINNEKDYIVSNGALHAEGFFCNVIDFLKIQDKIPEFVKLLIKSGIFDMQFLRSFKLLKLQKITAIIKNG